MENNCFETFHTIPRIRRTPVTGFFFSVVVISQPESLLRKDSFTRSFSEVFQRSSSVGHLLLAASVKSIIKTFPYRMCLSDRVIVFKFCF